MDYYRVSEQKVIKNLTLTDLLKMASEGSIANEDMVRLDGQEHFVPVLEVDQLKQALHSPPSQSVASDSVQHAPEASDNEGSGSGTAKKIAAGKSFTGDTDQAKIDFEAAAPIGRIGKRKSRDEDPGVDLTPMIDVVFLLLIFFIVTHTINAKPPIDLPEATFGKGLSPEGMQMILIDQDGKYYLGKKSAENLANGMDALLAEVSKNAQNAPEILEVVIDAHPETDHGNVRKVAEEIAKLENVGKISLGVAHKKE